MREQNIHLLVISYSMKKDVLIQEFIQFKERKYLQNKQMAKYSGYYQELEKILSQLLIGLFPNASINSFSFFFIFSSQVKENQSHFS